GRAVLLVLDHRRLALPAAALAVDRFVGFVPVHAGADAIAGRGPGIAGRGTGVAVLPLWPEAGARPGGPARAARADGVRRAADIVSNAGKHAEPLSAMDGRICADERKPADR